MSFVVLLAAVAGGLILAGLISGICLLIIGLARKRRGLWIGGLVTLVVSLAVGALAGLGLLTLVA